MRLLLALALSVACAAEPTAVSERDNGSTVQLERGDTLLVSLPVRLGTGFSWQVSEARGLEQQGTVTQERAKTAKPGAEARQVFRFSVKGDGALKAVYRRTFEKGVSPAKVFRIKIVTP